jgi:hypothetical protein
MRRFLSVFCLLTACAGTPDYEVGVVVPDMRDGPPPAMGTVTLTGADGAVQVLTTYDFSIGALDGSAWFGGFDQKYTLHLRAYPDQNPEAEAGIFTLEADLPGYPAAGMAGAKVKVEIGHRGQKDWRVDWSSRRQPSSVEITEVTRQKEGSSYGHAKGTFATVLCDMAAPEKHDCHDVTGSFDTDVQFDNVEVQPEP